MLMLKIAWKMIKALVLLPVWLMLCALWLTAKALVFAYCYLKGILNLTMILLLISTIVWYRRDYWRYIMLGTVGSISLLILLAGVTVEVVLEEMRKTIGAAMTGN